jgi:mannose/fructose/N-acetylgalactosamine-specific phosphotransferase system component IID
MKKIIKIRIFLRSFLIQTGWNYERMQNVGYAFAIFPALVLNRSKEVLYKALVRHLENFNTQPIMSSMVLGVSVKLEEELASREGPEADEIEKRIRITKRSMGSALGAIGDRFFWGILFPITVGIIVLTWQLGGFKNWILPVDFGSHSPDINYYVISLGITLSLIFYNSFAIWIRWRGLDFGYKCASSTSCGVDFIDWHKLINRLRVLGIFILSLITAVAMFVAFKHSFGSGAQGKIYIACSIGVFILGFTLKRFNHRNVFVFAAIAVASSIVFLFV